MSEQKFPHGERFRAEIIQEKDDGTLTVGQFDAMSVAEHEHLLAIAEQKAADELRNYQECLKTLNAVSEGKRELEKENERLREALGKISAHDPAVLDGAVAWGFKLIAREALADKAGKGEEK